MHPGWDRKERAAAKRALDEAASTRRLFPRGREDVLEPAVLQTLLAVALKPGAGVSELAERLALTSQAISAALRQLETLDLVALERDPEDARRRLTHLTPLGVDRARGFLKTAI